MGRLIREDRGMGISIEEKIKTYIKQLGADVCGIGEVSRFQEAPQGFGPKDIYEECQSVIAFGIALPKGLYEVSPRLIYGHFNEEICHTVDDIAIEAAKWIEEECHGVCIPMPCDGPHEYWDKETLTGKG